MFCTRHCTGVYRAHGWWPPGYDKRHDPGGPQYPHASQAQCHCKMISCRQVRMEQQLAKLSVLPVQVAGLEMSIQLASKHIDELYSTSLPAVANVELDQEKQKLKDLLEEKKRSFTRYHRQCPYMDLDVSNNKKRHFFKLSWVVYPKHPGTDAWIASMKPSTPFFTWLYIKNNCIFNEPNR